MTALSSLLQYEIKHQTLSSYQEIDSVDYSCEPKADVSNKAGASLVMSYLESFYYRTNQYAQCKQENIDSLYDKAKEFDKNDKPSLIALMSACQNLDFIKNANIAFFEDIDTLWFYMREYKSVIVQMKLTSTTRNAHSFEIVEEGETLDKDIAKCFILYRITPEYVILQNSLGTNCGVNGFNMVKLDLFKKLFINGACFTVEEDK